ncbi:hypothetical protein Bca4012_043997 [Brassica carinata]
MKKPWMLLKESIAAGDGRTCLETDGKCWGRNRFERLKRPREATPADVYVKERRDQMEIENPMRNPI